MHSMQCLGHAIICAVPERGQIRKLTSSGSRRDDSWCAWGTPGVSNILHLGGIKPGTLSIPAKGHTINELHG